MDLADRRVVDALCSAVVCIVADYRHGRPPFGDPDASVERAGRLDIDASRGSCSIEPATVELADRLLGATADGDTSADRAVRLCSVVSESQPFEPQEAAAALAAIERNWSSWGWSYLTAELEDAGLVIGPDGIERREPTPVQAEAGFDSTDEWARAIADAIDTDTRTGRQLVHIAEQRKLDSDDR